AARVNGQETKSKDPVRDDVIDALKTLAGPRPASTDPSDALRYKARPLDGIWATAPYLHNGSVPTLRALFMAPAARPKTFYVGSREFDPVNVGFDTTKAAGSFLSDTSRAGNSNAAHQWATTLPSNNGAHQ